MATETQPRGSLLVRTIKAVFEGQADAQRLAEVATESRKTLQEHRDNFHATLAALQPEVKEQVQPLIDAADGLLAALAHGLDLCMAYCEKPEPQLLHEAMALSDRGANQLNIVFFQLRNAALVAQGPTDIANLNLLLQCWDACKDDFSKGRGFREVVEAERQSSVTSIEQLFVVPQTPEVDGLRLAWEQHLRCMNRIVRAFDEHKDRAEVDREVENAKTTFTRIKETMPAAQMSMRTKGPTPDPQVNLVLSLARDVDRQVIHESLLVEALNSLYASLKETREKFEQAAKAPTDSVLIQEEVERGREALDLQDDALREFAQFMQLRNLKFLTAGMEKLERSAHAIHECYEQFQAIAEREGKTLCFRCGHYNPSNRKNCEKCQAALPVMSSTTTTSTVEASEGEQAQGPPQGPVLTENMVRLYTAVNKVAEGEISKEKFLEEVAWFEGLLEKNSEWDAEDEPDWDKLSEEDRPAAEAAFKAKEAVEEAFQQGYAEMQSALEYFRSFTESDLRSDLEEGVRQADAGARKLAAVQAAIGSKGAPQAEEADASIG